MYSIRGIKTFRGMEGQGLNATIYHGDQPVAFVLDDACGGEVQFDFTNPGQSAKSYERHHKDAKIREAEFHAFALFWYGESGARAKHDVEMREISGGNWDPREPTAQDAMESWVNHQVDEEMHKRRLDRLAKKKTIFRLKGDKPEQWRTLGAPYGPAIQAQLDRTYPGKVEEIWGVRS